jgi:hypothetical protein
MAISIELVLAGSIASVCTALTVIRLLQPEQEAKDAAEFLNKPLGWETRESDLEFARSYVRRSVWWWATASVASWIWFAYELPVN